MAGNPGGKRHEVAAGGGGGGGGMVGGGKGSDQREGEFMVGGGDAQFKPAGEQDGAGFRSPRQADVSPYRPRAIGDDQRAVQIGFGKTRQPVDGSRVDRGGDREGGGRAVHAPCLARAVPSGRYPPVAMERRRDTQGNVKLLTRPRVN